MNWICQRYCKLRHFLKQSWYELKGIIRLRLHITLNWICQRDSELSHVCFAIWSWVRRKQEIQIPYQIELNMSEKLWAIQSLGNLIMSSEMLRCRTPIRLNCICQWSSSKIWHLLGSPFLTLQASWDFDRLLHVFEVSMPKRHTFIEHLFAESAINCCLYVLFLSLWLLLFCWLFDNSLSSLTLALMLRPSTLIGRVVFGR